MPTVRALVMPALSLLCGGLERTTVATGSEISAIRPAADIGRFGGPGGDESGLDQRPLGRDALVACRRLEHPQAVPGRCELAEVPRRCQTAAGSRT